jgi:hypothetical protein
VYFLSSIFTYFLIIYILNVLFTIDIFYTPQASFLLPLKRLPSQKLHAVVGYICFWGVYRLAGVQVDTLERSEDGQLHYETHS